ncbi:hypothetical protein PsorP6_007798 [Peronosclerospora sorghi]|uniref:Uncharacterized protein n=1 Tax=Peronosclerospora sorghi TaxID=230839 RepID=A0ACC0WCM5_9STRA|nr:hypothetical protein PsorP6_007798 [Peronosclerospora sorghi]
MEVTTRLRVNRQIVDIIIGDILFDDDDEEADPSGDEVNVEGGMDDDHDVKIGVTPIMKLSPRNRLPRQSSELLHYSKASDDCGAEEKKTRFTKLRCETHWKMTWFCPIWGWEFPLDKRHV